MKNAEKKRIDRPSVYYFDDDFMLPKWCDEFTEKEDKKQ